MRLEKSPNDNENTDEIINDEVSNFAATCSVRMAESQTFNSSARDTSPAERGVEVLQLSVSIRDTWAQSVEICDPHSSQVLC